MAYLVLRTTMGGWPAWATEAGTCTTKAKVDWAGGAAESVGPRVKFPNVFVTLESIEGPGSPEKHAGVAWDKGCHLPPPPWTRSLIPPATVQLDLGTHYVTLQRGWSDPKGL